jgi:hypothetical protein
MAGNRKASLAACHRTFLTLVSVFVFFFLGLFFISTRASAEETLSNLESKPHFAKELILTAPFSVPRLSFFHATLEVPPLETALLLPQGDLYLRVTTSHASSVKEQNINGIKSHLNGLFHEWVALDASLGVFSRLEISGRIVVSGWDEQADKLQILDNNGYPIVRYEALDYYGIGVSGRNSNISKTVLQAKTLLFSSETPTFDLSLASSVKIPIGRARNLANAGTTDLNFFVLGSLFLNPLTLHANAGIGVPLGKQNLFVEEAGVDLNHFFHAGVGANWQINEGLAMGIQMEGNTTAFRDVPFLDYPAVTLFAGFRKLFGNIVVEGGVGTGLVRKGSYTYEYNLSVGYQFETFGKHTDDVVRGGADSMRGSS